MFKRILCNSGSLYIYSFLTGMLVFSSLSILIPEQTLAQNNEQNISVHEKDKNPVAEQFPPSLDSNKDQSQLERENVDISNMILQLMSAFPECGSTFSEAVKTFLVASPQSAEQVLQALKKTDKNSDITIVRECHNKSIGDVLAQIVIKLNETDPQKASYIMGLIVRSNNQSLQTAFLVATGDQTATTNQNNQTDSNPGQTGENLNTGSTGSGVGNATGTGGGFPDNTNSAGGGTVSPSN